MKLRTFFSLFFMVLVALAGVNLYVSLLLEKLGHEIERSQEQLKQSFKVADDFLTSSQNLTKFSRAYVITRNPSRREYYDIINRGSVIQIISEIWDSFRSPSRCALRNQDSRRRALHLYPGSDRGREAAAQAEA